MRPMFYTLSSMPPFKNILHPKNKIINKNAKLISQKSILLPTAMI